MEPEPRTTEQRILRVMRKVLANVVRDVTPRPDQPNPLSDATIRDIQECFALIAARERELADEQGMERERPYYPGEEPSAKVLKFSPTAKNDK